MKRNGGIVFAEKAALRDYVWRLDNVKGLALYALAGIATQRSRCSKRRPLSQRPARSGTERAQIMFSSDKQEITRKLVAIDLRRTTCLIRSMHFERDRAHAFVSMMAGRAVEGELMCG